MNKKLLSLVLALAMVFGSFLPVFAKEEAPKEAPKAEATTEAPAEKPAETPAKAVAAEKSVPMTSEQAEFLKNLGLVKGVNANGDLAEDVKIDRASFAALLVRAANKEDAANAVKTLGSRFNDMNAAHWANGYANVVADQQWMKGNEKGQFMPAKSITYAEIATTLVRFLGVDTTGYVYPTSYISKAFEMGLFKSIENVNYMGEALRGNIFIMFYNALSNKNFGKYSVYKMIVIENNRTAQMAKTAIKAEVISVIQESNQVDASRAKKGTQIVFDLKDTKWDSENLLGKVANITVDENGKLVKVEVDNTYDYVYGYITKENNGITDKNFKIARKNYGVRVDERYYSNKKRTESDDRMFRTYVTDARRSQNYHYQDFLQTIAREGKVNFARVTAKDGMVIFIDAYHYTDIAPVKEAAREGKEVYYYDDAKNAAVERFDATRTRVIGFTEKDTFHNMDAKDIKAEDVVHFMDGCIMVRRDAKVTDKLNKTYVNRDGDFAILGENDYYLNTKLYSEAPFNSVYAYDGKHFRTLFDRRAINDMVGKEKISALLDIFGDIQSIFGDLKRTDAVAMIDNVHSSKGIHFWAPNGQDAYKLNDAWDSAYYYDGWDKTSTRRYDEFDKGDLVYVRSNEEDIDVTALIRPYNTDVIGDGYDDEFEKVKFNNKYNLMLLGNKEMRYNEDTDAFVINVDQDGEIVGFKKVGMDKVREYALNHQEKPNYKMEAFVITEKEFVEFLGKRIYEDLYNMYSKREDLARILVFKNMGSHYDLAGKEFGKVSHIYNYGKEIEVQLNRYDKERFTLTKKFDGHVGDVISFHRIKGTEEGQLAKITEVNVHKNIKCYDIKNKTNWMLETEDGKKFYFNKKTVEFGATNNQKSAMIILDDETNKNSVYIDYSNKACPVAQDGKAAAKAALLAAIEKAAAREKAVLTAETADQAEFNKEFAKSADHDALKAVIHAAKVVYVADHAEAEYKAETDKVEAALKEFNTKVGIGTK